LWAAKYLVVRLSPSVRLPLVCTGGPAIFFKVLPHCLLVRKFKVVETLDIRFAVEDHGRPLSNGPGAVLTLT
jgi:hypothetical protein